MKDFLKYVLATVVGMIIIGVFTTVMSLLMFVAMVAAGNNKPTISDGSVLRISLKGSIVERVQDNPFNELLGNTALEEQGLDNLLAAIKAAKDNENIAGIYLDGGILSADFASLQELRKAIIDFKKSKKFVVAYGDTYTQGTYYVASAADKVYLNPIGMIEWHGLSSQPIFYKDLLEKVGVKMQVFKVGTYKSFVEPYTRTEMSEANREQVNSFIADIWGNICSDVAASRKVSVEKLNKLADSYIAMADAPDYVKNGLVDSLAYADGMRNKLRSLAKTDKVNLVEAADMASLANVSSANDRVAVYYAFGSIVGEEQSSPLNSESVISGPKVVDDLDKLATDDNVKAVVIRINSGGGSAFASEQMWHAIKQLKAKKPVVVSMGGMAASGGYYMSSAADYIIAEPTTLTGSIGIFGMFPDATGLLTEKLGLHFDVVKTNEASDFGALGRPLNAAEAGALQAYVNRGYALFLKRVGEGRGMKPETVDRIAQGRVWTGKQALGLKLVDRLGSLDDAIAEAARRAKLKDYGTDAYPQLSSWEEMFMTSVKADYMEGQMRNLLGAYYKPLMFAKDLKGSDCLQARMPFDPNIK